MLNVKFQDMGFCTFNHQPLMHSSMWKFVKIPYLCRLLKASKHLGETRGCVFSEDGVCGREWLAERLNPKEV